MKHSRGGKHSGSLAVHKPGWMRLPRVPFGEAGVCYAKARFANRTYRQGSPWMPAAAASASQPTGSHISPNLRAPQEQARAILEPAGSNFKRRRGLSLVIHSGGFFYAHFLKFTRK